MHSIRYLQDMHTLSYSQKLPLSLEQCWDFFSSPKNLKIITPEHLGFEILNGHDTPIYPGKMINYTIKPILNIPIEWVTEITHVQKPNYFIDEQRIGPYRLWHHEHHFEPFQNGVIMRDYVCYELYFGYIGKVVNSVWVKKELEAIFRYRKEKLEQLFNLTKTAQQISISIK